MASGAVANLTRAEYLLFEELVSDAAGFRLGDGDSTALRGALCERVAATGLAGFGEYYSLLRSPDGTGELGRLVELLTVHETAFFRNRPHFDVLARRIVPHLLSRARARPLRFWSAGCSTGQEAYSIAISLLETIPLAEQGKLEVIGTDISRWALGVAQTGVYSRRAVRNVDPTLLDRYFEPAGDDFQVGERVRRLVRFEYLNLVKEPFPLAAFHLCDVIFCENVTIYFKVESTRRVIRSFYETLDEGGYLFLGYAETLWQISDDYLLRDVDDTFLYQKPAAGAAAGEVPARGRMSPGARHLDRPPAAGAAPSRPARPRPAPPPRPPATLQEATGFYEAHRFAEALTMVENLLLAEPANGRAHLLAATLRADREEVGSALRHCRRALEADPLLTEGHYLQGLLLMQSGENRGAVESFSRVVYLNPTGHRSALAHFHMAGLHASAGSTIPAAREYRGALRLLEQFPRDELVGEFSADFLARVCRRQLEEMERGP